MPLPNVNFFYKMVAKRYGFWALRSEVCRGNSKGDNNGINYRPQLVQDFSHQQDVIPQKTLNNQGPFFIAQMICNQRSFIWSGVTPEILWFLKTQRVVSREQNFNQQKVNLQVNKNNSDNPTSTSDINA